MLAVNEALEQSVAVSAGLHSVTTHWANNRLEWKQHSRLSVQVWNLSTKTHLKLKKPTKKNSLSKQHHMTVFQFFENVYISLQNKILQMYNSMISFKTVWQSNPPTPVSRFDSVKVHLQKERKCVPCASRSREVSPLSLPLLGQTKPGTTSHWAQPVSPTHTHTHTHAHTHTRTHAHTHTHTHTLNTEGRRQGREKEHVREFKPLSLSLCLSLSSASSSISSSSSHFQ